MPILKFKLAHGGRVKEIEAYAVAVSSFSGSRRNLSPMPQTVIALYDSMEQKNPFAQFQLVAPSVADLQKVYGWSLAGRARLEEREEGGKYDLTIVTQRARQLANPSAPEASRPDVRQDAPLYADQHTL